MPLDPAARAFLDQGAALGFPSTHTLPVAEARELMVKRRAMLDATPEAVARIEDRTIPGPDGDVPVRLYAPSDERGLPVLVYFHGGGWVIGSIDTHDLLCRALANRAGCAVVSVDYRLAPEARFPAAAEDAYAATAWVAEHGDALGVDGGRVAVGGDSAGGNLTAAVALMARDRGRPPLLFQLLIYPVTAADFETASYQACAEGYGMSRADMIWFWDHYVPDAAGRKNPYAAPLHAADLSGLPPALVITAEYDTLCDEGEAFAARLHDAGVPTTLARYEGQIHGFVGNFAIMEQGRVAVDQAAEALREAFARGEDGTGQAAQVGGRTGA